MFNNIFFKYDQLQSWLGPMKIVRFLWNFSFRLVNLYLQQKELFAHISCYIGMLMSWQINRYCYSLKILSGLSWLHLYTKWERELLFVAIKVSPVLKNKNVTTANPHYSQVHVKIVTDFIRINRNTFDRECCNSHFPKVTYTTHLVV